MSKIPFNVDAYTAKLIGRENLSKVESAVIELIKNTYDADASVCVLYYEKSSNILYLCDNGTGMTTEVIRRHWMTIGYSSKVTTYISGKGRVQTGAKGIGRFALDRISNKCEMLTKTKENSIKWMVNWDDFNCRKHITEVYADIEEKDLSIKEFLGEIKNPYVKKLIEDQFVDTGTVFKLKDLRDEWTDTLINRIYKTLYNIISPTLKNIFKIYFFTEETDIQDAEICTDTMQAYDYKISFDVDNKGNADIYMHRNEFNFGEEFERVMLQAEFTEDDKKYFLGELINRSKNILDLVPGITEEDVVGIGPFSGNIYFNKIGLNKVDKERYFYKDITGRKNYAKEFGGIKIFRDKFKVRPYGDYGTQNFDWLMLSERKTKSPAAIASEGVWKVRGEQIIGEVNISRSNLKLADQANREGLLETNEFFKFKAILTSIIDILEKDRQYVVRKIGKMHKDNTPVEQYKLEIIEMLQDDSSNSTNDNKKEEFRSKVVEAYKVKAVLDERDLIIKSLEDENAMLKTLATTGIVTNTYIHELKGLSNDLFSAIIDAKESLQDIIPADEDDVLKNEMDEILESIKEAYSYKNKFSSWFKVTIETVREDRRHMKVWSINYLIRNLTKSWEEVLAEKNIKIHVKDEKEIEQKCYAYEIESVIHNLVANSVSAFERKCNFEIEKNIKIGLEEWQQGFIINYQDNGPGLTQAFKNNPRKILEAFETDKWNNEGERIGTGMGMWIINRIVENYNGRIDLNDNISEQTGFRIKLYLGKRSK